MKNKSHLLDLFKESTGKTKHIPPKTSESARDLTGYQPAGSTSYYGVS